jgi:hypothetical protein
MARPERLTFQEFRHSIALDQIIAPVVKDMSGNPAPFMNFVISQEDFYRHFGQYIHIFDESMENRIKKYGQENYKTFSEYRTLMQPDDIEECCYIALGVMGEVIQRLYLEPTEFDVPVYGKQASAEVKILDKETVLLMTRNKMYELLAKFYEVKSMCLEGTVQ